jgi:hypothetical protein
VGLLQIFSNNLFDTIYASIVIAFSKAERLNPFFLDWKIQQHVSLQH